MEVSGMEYYERINEEYKNVYGVDLLGLMKDIMEELSDTTLAYADVTTMEEGQSSASMYSPEHASIITSSIYLGVMNLAARMVTMSLDDIVNDMYSTAEKALEDGERISVISTFSAIGAKIAKTVLERIGVDENGWNAAFVAAEIAALYCASEFKRYISLKGK